LIHFYKRYQNGDMKIKPELWHKLAPLGLILGLASVFHVIPLLFKKPEDQDKPQTLSGLLARQLREDSRKE